MIEFNPETVKKLYRKYTDLLYNRYFFVCLIASVIGILCLCVWKLKQSENDTLKSPSYVVGLAYYELGGKTVIINAPASIPQNTAIIITLYEAYNPGFLESYDANVNIEGAGRSHIVAIIWSTYESSLHFNSNAVTKRLKYMGYKGTSVNEVAQKEFGRNADSILSSYRSPLAINLFITIPTKPPSLVIPTKPVTPSKLIPSYIVGLAYYELGGETVTVNVPSSIPNGTVLIITLYAAYHPGFRKQYDANVNIEGAGRSHIVAIIWSTYESSLHFNSNAVTKRLKYMGYKGTSVNQVAQNEFGRNANIILSSYASPLYITIHSN